MKKYICVTIAITFTISLAFAQSSEAGIVSRESSLSIAEKAKEATDKVNAAVQLTPGQYSEIVDILTGFFSEAQVASTGRGGKTTAQIFAERSEKLEAILTVKQWRKAQEAGILEGQGMK